MKGRLVIALALLPVLLATLVPGGRPQSYGHFATEWLSDALLNVALFVPLGAALAAARVPMGLVLGLVAALSGFIEMAQLLIPGRDPSPLDLVTNTLGGVAGALVVRSASGWLRPAPAAAHRLALGAAAAASGIILLTALLTRPQLPHVAYYAQWTPSLGHLEWYRGRVLSARFGGAVFASGLLRDSAGVRRALREGPLFEVTAVAGPPTSRLASLVSIYDYRQREIILLGPDRDDMVMRLRTRAAAIGLAQPSLRWSGVLHQVQRGDTISVRLRQVDRRYCLDVDRREECIDGYRAGSGWSLLRRITIRSAGAGQALGAAWLALLTLPVGFWVRRWSSLLLAALVLGAGLVAGGFAGLAPLAWWEIVGLAAGVAAGLFAAKAIREE